MAYHIPGIDAIQSGGSSSGSQAQSSVTVSVKTSQLSESDVQTKGKAVEQISDTKKAKSEDVVLKSNDDVLEIENAVEKLNKKLDAQHQDLNVGFSVDDESGRIVVRISDQGSGKLIRQIPSEETLEFARNVKTGKGLLLNTKI